MACMLDEEIEAMIELAEECRDFEGMRYKDGVKEALEWVLYGADAPFTEEDKKC